MNASYDDPKYTAYVLGELDAAEREAVEAELRADPQLAAAVTEIRVATERLTQLLQCEHLPRLHEGQRAALLGRETLNGSAPSLSPRPSPVEAVGENLEKVEVASGPSRPRRLSWRGRLLAAGTLAAAAGLLVALLTPSVQNARESSRQTAKANQDELSTIVNGIQTETWDELGGSGTVKGFYQNLPLSFTEEESVRNANRWHAQPPQAGTEFKFHNNFYSDPQSGSHYINGRQIQETRNKSDMNNPAGSSGAPIPSPTFPSINVIGTDRFGAIQNGQPQSDGQNQGQQQDQQSGNQQQQGNQQKQPSQPPMGDFAVGQQPAKITVGATQGNNNGQQNQQQGGQQSKVPLRQTWGYNQTRGPRDFLAKDQQTNAENASPDKSKSESRDKEQQLLELGLESTVPQGARGRLGEQSQRYEWGHHFMFGDLSDSAAGHNHNTEAYDYVNDNPFLGSGDNPLSTFSIDVDTASYSNVRRFLMQQNQRPPRGAVRIEELVNYFRYDYPQPEGDKPFSVTTEVASCPWEPKHRLVRIGLKGREVPKDKRPLTNLVFLIDTSGSMQPANKLPLVKQSLKMLAEQLGENDKVSMVVYAGSAGLVLPSTRGDNREAILNAIDQLDAGGSTNGAQGIELAYEIATNNLQKGGVNRVILATDGDFNVGVTNQDDLVRLIEEKAKTGVFLTTLGFGMGNIKDSTLEKLADKGNGNYAYIDDLPEARKVLVEEIGSTLVTIAKDVKIQVEFNPAEVAGYRLIGYENRIMAKEDFNDDKKDAGEIGAGHTVTALYECVPTQPAAGGERQAEKEISEKQDADKSAEGDGASAAAVDSLKYQKPASLSEAAKTGELFTLKLRYKKPDGDKSTLIETPVKDAGKKYGEASADFKFAAAVASFGMILRDSPYKGNATIAAVEELAAEGVSKKDDKHQTDVSYRAEFVEMVKKAKVLGAP